jgi:hypothetical protein
MNIETGTVSLKTMLAAMAVAVGAGIAWQAVLSNIEQARAEKAEIKQALAAHDAQMNTLTMVICLQNDATAMRCRQYGALQ